MAYKKKMREIDAICKRIYIKYGGDITNAKSEIMPYADEIIRISKPSNPTAIVIPLVFYYLVFFSEAEDIGHSEEDHEEMKMIYKGICDEHYLNKKNYD